MLLTLSMVGMKAMSFLCGSPRIESFTKALVPTKKLQDAINSNISLPPSARGIVPNSNNPRAISLGDSKVSAVLACRNASQVANPVVGSVPVDMVNFLRPLPIGDEPRNAMRNCWLSSHCPRFISIAVDGVKCWASSIPCVEHSALLLLGPHAFVKHIWRCVVPCHVSRFRVVCDKLLGNLLGYHSRLLVADTRNYNIVREV